MVDTHCRNIHNIPQSQTYGCQEYSCSTMMHVYSTRYGTKRLQRTKGHTCKGYEPLAPDVVNLWQHRCDR